MAVFPNSFRTQRKLQPGARGEKFQTNMPGYRTGEDRINRTNMRLNISQHDTLNIKYILDERLPVLFRNGYAVGYNQMVIPKGRIVAVDQYADIVEFDSNHSYNTLTIANGGVPVRLRTHSDTYQTLTSSETDIISTEAQGKSIQNINTEWTPLIEKTYESNTMRPFKEKTPSNMLKEAGYEIDEGTGKVMKTDSKETVDFVRHSNKPIGILERNEYTRDQDAFNGMMPGPIRTDAIVELPWFAYKDKAESNPWGSIYGNIHPGCLIKSDENGRCIPSPLNYETILATMSIAEYEQERQQVIGEVCSVDNSLLPEGTYRWATWALEDRLKFQDFNPETYRQTNRRGEDVITHSPYTATGPKPGYGYDKAYTDHDLHMLGSTLRGYNERMNQEYQYENLGIPGLTDGKNAVIRNYDPEIAGSILPAGNQEYERLFFRTLEVDIEPKTLQISLGESAFVPCTEGAEIAAKLKGSEDTFIKVDYADEKQGIVTLVVTDKAKADKLLANGELTVRLKYKKRGLSGVPTFMDWDGCVGSAKIILQK